MGRTTVVGSVAGASPPTERPPRCPETGHTKTGGYATAKFGVQHSADGPKQKYRCPPPDGTSHYYTVVPASSDGPNAPVGPAKRHHLRKHDVALSQEGARQAQCPFQGHENDRGWAHLGKVPVRATQWEGEVALLLGSQIRDRLCHHHAGQPASLPRPRVLRRRAKRAARAGRNGPQAAVQVYAC